MVAKRCPLVLLVVWMLLTVVAVGQEVLIPAVGVHRGGESKQSSSVELPFFDDFATGQLSPIYWANNQATVGVGYAPYPPTLGMVTLDAIDGNGRLYSSSTSPFPADTLLSNPIRLDSTTSPLRESLNMADSVYLSFYYSPGGAYSMYGGRIGDTPEAQDSLVLDFYSPIEGKWTTVWATEGIDPDELYNSTGSYWQKVMIAIKDAKYFADGFRIRFRNICSLDPMTTIGLIGNSDHWHIDCIYIDRDRSAEEEFERDVAFVNPARTLLKYYTAMPARQYRISEMAEKIEMTITNRYSQTLASHYEYRVSDSSGQQIHYYDGGFENIPSFVLSHSYQEEASHASPPIGFQYPENRVPMTYRVEHVVKEGVAGDRYPQNDTTKFLQVFGDYYAYDDGTAESGYGLTSTSSNVYIAYMYQLNESDTLQKVRIAFNHTRDDASEGIAFRLVVWNSDGCLPGEEIYRDNMLRYPQVEGLNEFHDYWLEEPLALGGGVVFIGIEQEGGTYLNIGFDRNNNSADRLYYCVGSEWLRSSLAGALMFRPCFTLTTSSLWIDPSTADKQKEALSVYPNPVQNMLHVTAPCPDATINIYNIRGVAVCTEETDTIDVSYLPQGIYIVEAKCPNGQQYTQKVIVKNTR